MIAAVILAGGRARRLGGIDKGHLLIGGQSILSRIAATLAPQVDALALNANDDPTRFAHLGLQVLPDTIPDHPGPLAGILAGLDWAAGQGARALVSVPCDTPFLPPDLVQRLTAAATPGGYACAASASRVHPATALWPIACRHTLRAALAAGLRRVSAAQPACGIAEWPTQPGDPFFNVNTPEDLAQAELLAAIAAPAPPPPTTAV